MAEDKKKKATQEQTHFEYEGQRGSGQYPIDDPGMLGEALEQMRVGDYNMPEFRRQREMAKARRGR